MRRWVCRVIGHTTNPPRRPLQPNDSGPWWPSWVCSRCRLNLRPDKRRPTQLAQDPAVTRRAGNDSEE